MTTKEVHEFSEVPYNYSLCLNAQCPKASTCLRQLVEQEITDSTKHMVIINPKYQATLKGDCPDYRSCKKVQYAKGFMNTMRELSQNQLQGIIPQLISRFSRRTYYRIRKGERLLSPAEQREVNSIFKSCGVKESIKFDGYVEDYEW